MGKKLFIAEKPSVAAEFAKVLKADGDRKDGYIEGSNSIVTWCVGHLVTMSYPEAYDPGMKKWSLNSIPFLPENYLYEIIPGVAKQFNTVKKLLNRSDVDTIYVCTDSGREGEYIYRLVDRMAQVPDTKKKLRVWIDSQTEEEIIRGIKEARPLADYDNLSDAAYLRAIEDYLMGINFSRVLTLKYGNMLMDYKKTNKWSAISVGRVMTCVLGIVVRREREIREFKKTPFYRVASLYEFEVPFEGEFKAVDGSKYYESPLLYKDNGFRDIETCRTFVEGLGNVTKKQPELLSEDDKQNDKLSEEYSANELEGLITSVDKKTEKKNPPLLYNLAELQNECSQSFKISPDETLKVVQELYEKKLVTYPRTDARVLSSAVAKEITKNIKGVAYLDSYKEFGNYILENGTYKNLSKTRYVNDSQITDHYAIIPTGQGLGNLKSLNSIGHKVYDKICRRFLSIFYPSAEYQKITISVKISGECFISNIKALKNPGYLVVAGIVKDNKSQDSNNDNSEEMLDNTVFEKLNGLRKGMSLKINGFKIKEGETTPPKRYTSGTLILTMERAGQFIEDEELRATIKGQGIGTSATRAEILNKLVKIQYLSLNSKTQIVTPTFTGEMVYEIVNASVKSLLNAELTASWEKGLNYVAEGEISRDEYMVKLNSFVGKWTNYVKQLNNSRLLYSEFDKFAQYYKNGKGK